MGTAKDDESREPTAEDRADWQRVEEVLSRWWELSDSEGSHPGTTPPDWEDLCDGDEELQRRVRPLVAAWGERNDVLSRGARGALPDLLERVREELEEEPRQGLVGETIDRYRLVEILGHGGMGVVYAARRADAAFDKRVALKLLPRGLETPETERRFRTERQILARLEHPHIARLLDGGVTREGFPYLVMELVEGEALDAYCTRRRLDLTQRVELFLDACDAVHYAHQNLVIHRDLKPQNIFVTADGVVKLLDFGVAKMLDAPESASTTRVQPMTPRYASPEQRHNLPVSTASDVYSLGAVLTKLTNDLAVAANRATIAADVALIARRAQRDDPAERFRSVAEMADDLRSALAARPISSRPRTWTDRLRRAIRRHRLATAALVAAGLSLLGGFATALWQANVARQQRDRARLEAGRTQQVSDLMANLFASASPFSGSAGQLTAEELLVAAADRVERELAGEPALRGQILSVLAGSLASVGERDEAWDLARRAVEDLRLADPADARALASALRVQATLVLDFGRRDPAPGDLLEEALELLVATGAEESVERARVERQLGRAASREGDRARALEHHQAGLTLLEKHGLHSDAAIQRTYLASSLRALGDDESALEHDRRALAVLERSFGPDHPNVASTRNNLAVAASRLGRYREAELLLREALATSERVLGPEHPSLASTLTNLGRVLTNLGRFTDAEEPLRRAVAIRRQTTGPASPTRLGAEINLARFESIGGDRNAAVASLREALERFERLSGDTSGPTVRVRSLLAEALRRRARDDDRREAERLVRSAIVHQDPTAGGSSPPLVLADSLTTLGRLLLELGAPEEATGFLRRAADLRSSSLAAESWQLAEVRLSLAAALLAAEPGSSAPHEARRLVLSSRAARLDDPRLADLRHLREELARRLALDPGEEGGPRVRSPQAEEP